MKNSHRRRTAAGFTLLEVMLAMVALALVAMICYGAFHLGIRAVERGEVAVVTAQRLRVASDVLIRQVKSAVPYPARNEDEEVYPYFFGTPTSMSFVTAAALSGGGGLARVSYDLGQNENGMPELTVGETSSFSPDALGGDRYEPVGARSTVLLDGFHDLKFQYLLSDGADVEWRDSWSGRDEEIMPTAVRIVIDGVPGLETGTWGQEIPIIATSYSEGAGEVDDESLQDRAEKMANGASGTNNDVGSGEGEGGEESGDAAEGADEEE
jgi:prepilin-type N-terminal cleavage/methylation domain-containing protein